MSWLDLRMGLRMLVKHPALTIVGGLGMAVAIAISVGFFAFTRSHIYPALPLEEGDRIVALENRDVELNNEERRSLHDFVLWRAELRAVRDLGAFRTVARNLVGRDGPAELVRVAEMTASGFRVARVPPLLGRWLLEEDELPGAAPVVVIGHDAWKSRFGGDPSVLGRAMVFGRTPHTVVGVMPEGFGFPINHDYWMPFRADPAAYARREGPAIYIFGRLAPDATVERAQSELEALGRRTASEFPESNATLRPMVMPYTHSITDVQGISIWAVLQVNLMVGLLLVVVALNVAVLVYARTAMRQGELAVRAAMGASRRRIVGQLFVEALVLALLSAAGGLALARVGVGIGNRIIEEEMALPFWMDYSLRPATVLYTIAVAVVAAVIVGVLPALQATGRNLERSLRGLGGGTGIRLGKTWTTLVVAQVAIAVAALPAAANMGWGEIRNATTRPAYAAHEFIFAPLRGEAPDDGGGADDPRADSLRFGSRLVEVVRRLEEEPGVLGATYTAERPEWTTRIRVEGVPDPAESSSGHRVEAHGVALDYLALYDARVLAGRDFAPGDLAAEASAAIVTESFVRQVLGDAPALGRRFHYAPDPWARQRKSEEAEPPRWYEIVGVVGDFEVNELDRDLVGARILHPVAPELAQAPTIEARVRGATPADVGARMREIVFSVDPALRLGTPHTLDVLQRQESLAIRLVALAVGLVLASVLLLSAAGVYALTSFTVTRRRREIGIRSALGAHPREVLRAIFARVARQIALGVALGAGIAALADRVSGGDLFDGRAGILLPAFAVLMAIVALLAAVGPARRGLRIQPSEALRAEA